MNVKKLTRLSLLTSLAIIIFVIESQLPPITPIPGIKMGLANIITLVTLSMFGKKEAFCVLMLRIVLGNIFAGQPSALLYSGAGGLFCFVVMSLIINAFPQDRLWIVSIFGSLSHVTAQICVAALITSTREVFWYLPLLAISAVVTGAFTGLCACFVLRRRNK